MAADYAEIVLETGPDVAGLTIRTRLDKNFDGTFTGELSADIPPGWVYRFRETFGTVTKKNINEYSCQVH